jgi:hypothetical protein
VTKEQKALLADIASMLRTREAVARSNGQTWPARKAEADAAALSLSWAAEEIEELIGSVSYCDERDRQRAFAEWRRKATHNRDEHRAVCGLSECRRCNPRNGGVPW